MQKLISKREELIIFLVDVGEQSRFSLLWEKIRLAKKIRILAFYR